MSIQPAAFSVSQLNREVRQLLEQGFPMIHVEGEISNFVCPASGHWYFTLKDSQAQVRCALFRNRNRFLKYRPRNGDQVRLRAKVSLYEGRGEFQLIGDYLEEAGAGALQAAFEALKFKLEQEGLFDPSRKQPLPTLPGHIGVVTSPTGAAVRDILTVLRRRFPSIPVSLYPSAVQGDDAPLQLVRAIELAVRDRRCDLLIVGRGGGSLEDLWPFNDERVARTIAACPVPVISAVGHETDFSISDFVADLRAPTPSAAAELASPDGAQLLERFRLLEAQLHQRQRARLEWQRHRLDALGKRLRHPGQRLQDQAQRLDGLELRLQRVIRTQLNQHRQRLSHHQERLRQGNPQQRILRLQQRCREQRNQLQRALDHRLERLRLQLGAQIQGLNAVSPLATLERGYAIVQDGSGGLVRSFRDVKPGDPVRARLADGELACQVTACHPPEK